MVGKKNPRIFVPWKVDPVGFALSKVSNWNRCSKWPNAQVKLVMAKLRFFFFLEAKGMGWDPNASEVSTCDHETMW